MKRLYSFQNAYAVPRNEYEPVMIVSTACQDLPFLDMSYASLRSVSSIHLKHFQDMGVRGTLNIAIILHNSVWETIICQHRRQLTPSAEIRAVRDPISKWVGMKIAQSAGRVKQPGETAFRQISLAITANLDAGPSQLDGVADSAAPLMELVDITRSFIQVGGRRLILVMVRQGEYLPQLIDTLWFRQAGTIIAVDQPQVKYQDFCELEEYLSSVLILPIDGHSGDAVNRFRPGVQGAFYGADTFGGRVPYNKMRITSAHHRYQTHEASKS